VGRGGGKGQGGSRSVEPLTGGERGLQVLLTGKKNRVKPTFVSVFTQAEADCGNTVWAKMLQWKKKTEPENPSVGGRTIQKDELQKKKVPSAKRLGGRKKEKLPPRYLKMRSKKKMWGGKKGSKESGS